MKESKCDRGENKRNHPQRVAVVHLYRPRNRILLPERRPCERAQAATTEPVIASFSKLEPAAGALNSISSRALVYTAFRFPPEQVRNLLEKRGK